MNDKTTNIILGGILAILLVILMISIQPKRGGLNLGGAENDLGLGASSTAVKISTSTAGYGNVQLVAESMGCLYRRIQNLGPNYVTCQLEASTSTLATSTGIRLATTGAESIYEIDYDNLYCRKINCIAEYSTGTVIITQK